MLHSHATNEGRASSQSTPILFVRSLVYSILASTAAQLTAKRLFELAQKIKQVPTAKQDPYSIPSLLRLPRNCFVSPTLRALASTPFLPSLASDCCFA